MTLATLVACLDLLMQILNMNVIIINKIKTRKRRRCIIKKTSPLGHTIRLTINESLMNIIEQSLQDSIENPVEENIET